MLDCGAFSGPRPPRNGGAGVCSPPAAPPAGGAGVRPVLGVPLRKRVQALILGAAVCRTQPTRMRRSLRPCLAAQAPVLKSIAALHLLSVLCGGAWLSHSVRPSAFGHAGGAWVENWARSGGGEMPRSCACVPAPSCLQLRGGKVKYKDLKVVKKARERRARTAAAQGEAPESAAQDVHIGGDQHPPQTKVRGGKRARKK